MSNIVLSLNNTESRFLVGEDELPVGVRKRLMSLFRLEVVFKRPAYRNGVRQHYMDTFTRTFNYRRSGGWFPTGWVGRVLDILEDSGVDFNLIDERKIDEGGVKAGWAGSLGRIGIHLRDYQEKAVSGALAVNRGIIEHATGAGKTIEQMALVENLGRRALILVPSVEILNQSYKRFRKVFGRDVVGKVGDGKRDIEKDIVISTAQSLWRGKTDWAKGLIKSAEVLILDEAHHAGFKPEGIWGGTTWYALTMWMTKAYFRFGFTATPGEEGTPGRRLLEAATGRVLHRMGVNELREQGWLVSVVVRMYRIQVRVKGLGWLESYKKNVEENDERNQLLVDKIVEAFDRDKMILVIVERIRHGLRLRSLLEGVLGSGVVQIMTGDTPSGDRKRMIKLFREFRRPIMIGTVFGEGVDIPEVDVLVVAGAGKSSRGVVQKVGRALRISEGKQGAEVIDIMDTGGGMMERHAKERKRIYKKLGFKVEVK